MSPARRRRRRMARGGGTLVVDAPPLPHERDQMSGTTAAEVDPRIARAHADLEAGQVDTDLRTTPGLDAAARRRKVPGSH